MGRSKSRLRSILNINYSYDQISYDLLYSIVKMIRRLWRILFV